jgi:hypothetical protein
VPNLFLFEVSAICVGLERDLAGGEKIEDTTNLCGTTTRTFGSKLALGFSKPVLDVLGNKATKCPLLEPLVRIGRILLERIEIHLIQCALVRGLHLHLRNTLL